jgi:GDPmannose 4,6-dehydratase
MAARTAIITGALGQDGSLLAELLLSRGYRVVGVIRAGSVPPVEGPLAAVVFVEIDLADATAVRSLLEQWRPDELYHLAAFHHSSADNSVSAALAGKDAMLTTNFLSTKTLAFALVETQLACHLVFASSSQVFTAVDMSHEVSERSSRQPSTFYGHVKSWSMDLLAFLRNESGLHASAAILFNHESPRRGAQFVSRKITCAAAQAAAGRRPALKLHNIGSRVDWSSARDVVGALSLMGRSEAPRDYVVASGSLHSVRDLLQTAFGNVGLDWTQFASFDEDRVTPALVGQSRALEESLGWRRAMHFDEMVREMVAHDLSAIGLRKS